MLRKFYINLFLILYFELIFSGCSSHEIGSLDSDKVNLMKSRARIDNVYFGQSFEKSSKEEALNLAKRDAINQIVSEIGVHVQSAFKDSLTESDRYVNVFVESKVKTQALGFLKGLKLIDKYIETGKKGKDVFYNGFVNVKLPHKEIEEARKRIDSYDEEIIKEAAEIFRNANGTKDSNPYEAMLGCKTVMDMLKNVWKAEAKSLITQAQSLIGYLEAKTDPLISLENLEGNTEIIESACLSDFYGSCLEKNIIRIGDRVKVKLELLTSSYLYIISYDREGEEASLILPNKFDTENLKKGEVIYPENSCFTAEAPSGLNTIYLISSEKRVKIPPFGEKDYCTFRNEELVNFLTNLKGKKFDVKKVDFYID
jgi:hypothetical protein